MQINKKKSGIMFFKKRKTKQKENDNMILGYPIVNEYKYLGIYLDDRMNLNRHIEHIKEKIIKGMKMAQIIKWKNSSL